MLSAADLASMQAAVRTGMTLSCTISRVTRTGDGQGGVAESWATASTTVCRVAPYKRLDNEQILEGRLGLTNRWVITLPAGTDVTPKDRIVAQGLTYEVSSVSGPRINEVHRSALCYLVQ